MDNKIMPTSDLWRPASEPPEEEKNYLVAYHHLAQPIRPFFLVLTYFCV
jgi:hypothetical protein